tara:strand:+ start:180 stop:470 length:291 start_codon:yes stop_codon:yes gene_type:complete
MAITKEAVVEKIEVVGSWNIQVATDTKIMEDSKEIARSRKRHILIPFSSSKDSDDKWTHTDTDISGEEVAVRAIANAAWTDTVKANYKTWKEARGV